MRIRPLGIIIVLAIVAILGYMVLKPKLNDQTTTTTTTDPEPWNHKTETTEGTATNSEANEGDKENSPKSTSEAREFNYTPEKPENGTLKGVVELGATGFNSFVINMDKKNRWEIKSKDFGESLAYEGLASTDDIRAGLKKYISGMFDKGVAKTNMHFVISSGAQKEPKTKLISNELKKMGFVVNNVTPE